MSKFKFELSDRLLNFSINIIRMTRILPSNIEYHIIIKQLIRSATSIGANYEEAQAAYSKADFHHKLTIALKESRESAYWIKILEKLNNDELLENELLKLQLESKELSNIFGSICSKTRNK